MSVTSSTGPIRSLNGFQIGPNDSSLAATSTPIDANGNMFISSLLQIGGLLGARNSVSIQPFGKGAIVDNTATPIITFTVPNVAQSGVARLLIRTGYTQASHIYDSTRVVEYLLAITRVPGAATVAVLSAAIGAQIATSSGGRTLTTTPTVSAITGAVGVTQTFDLNITNVASTGGDITETYILCELINAATTGITFALSA